ncbi:MAG: class IV adenylate cyclase [Planctomycetota bacterium]
MFEVELKYRVPHPETLRRRMIDLGGVFIARVENRDTYFNHPSRDFRQTGEAFRIRHEDGIPMVTYKSPKVADHNQTGVKARRELEWRLDPGDADGSRMQSLLLHLGFEIVAQVVKWRESFRLDQDDDRITLTLDEVYQHQRDSTLGWYCEIESVFPMGEPPADQVDLARQRLMAVAEQLELTEVEPLSYLRLVLADQTD